MFNISFCGVGKTKRNTICEVIRPIAQIQNTTLAWHKTVLGVGKVNCGYILHKDVP